MQRCRKNVLKIKIKKYTFFNNVQYVDLLNFEVVSLDDFFEV